MTERAEYKADRAEFKAAKKAARQARNREIRADLGEQRRQFASRRPERLRFTATPGGTLAALRQQCHDSFDPLWKSGRVSRQQMYRHLARWMGLRPGECHFGMFDCEECRRALAAFAHPKFLSGLPLAPAPDPMAEP